MSKSMTIQVSKMYVHNEEYSNVPLGTKTRTYTGDFVLVMHNFYPNGTMEFIVFTKDTNKHLTTFNRSQINDFREIMDIVADRKEELYPPEFL